jgi:hypothetical protein
LIEFILVNVGGSPGNDKPSSPVMFVESVGGVIVLGAEESSAQGEGRQEKDIP